MRWLTIILVLVLCVGAQGTTVEIDSAWADTTTTGIPAAVSGDTIRLTEDIYRAKWGVILPDANITLDGDGYTLYYDTITTPTITNPGFETGDFTGWDVTEAESCFVVAGDTAESPTLEAYRGGYGCAVHLPCDTQFVTATTAFSFPSGHRWAAGAFAIKQVTDTNLVEMHFRLLDDNGDVWYDQYFAYRGANRGFEPVFCDFLNDTDSTLELYPQLMVAGGSTMADGNIVYFDHIRAMTAGYSGVVVAPDTNQWLEDGIWLQNVGGGFHYPRYLRDYPAHGTDGDSCVILDLGIVDDNDSYLGCGVWCGANGVTVRNCWIDGNGFLAYNVYGHGSTTRMRITNNAIRMRDGFESIRDRNHCASVGIGIEDLYGWDNWVDSNTIWGSRHCGVLAKTRCYYGGTYDSAFTQTVVYDNDISINSYYSNGFCVYDGGEAPCIIRKNRFTTYDGSDTISGEGVQVTGKRSTAPQIGYVDSNTIVVSTLGRNQESYHYDLAYGIQLEGAYNMVIRENTITAYGTTGGCDGAYAFRMNYNTDGGAVDSNLNISQNTFRAYSYGDVMAVPFRFYIDDTNDPYEAQHLWTIDSNSIAGNGNWIAGIAGVVDAGLTMRYTTFTIDSLSGAAPPPDWQNWIAGQSRWYEPINPVDTLLFVDNQYTDAATKTAFDSSFATLTVDTTAPTFYQYADTTVRYLVGWTVTVNVEDSLSALVEGAPYTVLTTDGDTLYDDVASSGEVSFPVWEYEEKAAAKVYNRNDSRTYFNDYTFVAWDPTYTYTDTSVVTIDAAQTVTLTLTLGAAAAATGKRLLLRSN